VTLSFTNVNLCVGPAFGFRSVTIGKVIALGVEDMGSILAWGVAMVELSGIQNQYFFQ
jgi:hypothetical protein